MASAPVLATEPTAIEPAPKSAAAIIKIPNTVANAISIASLTNLRPELFEKRDREQIAREEGHEIRERSGDRLRFRQRRRWMASWLLVSFEVPGAHPE